MEKIELKKIFTKKNQDYTYVVLFLIIFSIFIFFAINPSLKTAFSLKKEKVDLENINNIYEQKIINIANIQNQLEENREKLHLVDQALSKYPQVNKMVDDIKIIADKNNFQIQKANIVDVDLSILKKNSGIITLIIEGKTSFDNLNNLITDVFNQRRLKTIENLVINQDKESTQSNLLKVTLTINGYYL